MNMPWACLSIESYKNFLVESIVANSFFIDSGRKYTFTLFYYIGIFISSDEPGKTVKITPELKKELLNHLILKISNSCVY